VNCAQTSFWTSGLQKAELLQEVMQGLFPPRSLMDMRADVPEMQDGVGF